VALARRALEISRNCADAYVLLAEEVASSEAEQEALFTQGVAAGERALGKAAFEEDAGHFWGLHQTRPYMRARAGLAQCLRRRRDLAGAIGHFEDMLRLNPNDNQGVRWELAACLLEAGRDEALGQLLARYDGDGSAPWTYSRALLAFRRGGENAASRAALAQARARNPHVCAYLLGAKKLPRDLPEYIGIGDENEAVIYVAEHHGAWKASAGALEWLAAATGPAPARRKATQAARR
jgi:tetratricopeptide (TPR) repeat protein